MPKKNEVAILDIGSGRITVLVGEQGLNDIPKIICRAEIPYDGYSDGEFLVPEKLSQSFKQAISNAEDIIKKPIKKIFVGIPGEFTSVKCKDSSISFRTKRKVTEIDIAELYKSGENLRSGKYTFISHAPIYFILDETQKLLEPIGKFATQLSARMSFVFAETKILSLISDALINIGIENFEFICSAQAQGVLLFEDRDKPALIADIGYLSSSVSLLQGDGLLYIKSFSAGGAYISADLMECLEIPFETADKLKDKININLSASNTDRIVLDVGSGEKKEINLKTAGEIVSARIESLAEMVQQCVKDNTYGYPDNLPLYLTGGGISYIRGAKDILATVLDKNVEIAVPQIPKLSKPHLASSYGVLRYALKKQTQSRTGFWSKIFG